MSEVFSILLHNRQRYEQGKEGLWFSLPTTTEKLQEALREIGISADNPQDFFLYDYRSPQERSIKLPRDLVLSADVDELNFLAARLEKLDAAELSELNAALTSPQSDFHSIGQIIDYPDNVDYYVHLPDVTGTGQLGDYYLNRSGMVDMPEEWKAGIFLPRFGLHIANTEHGVFTDYGYLVKSGDEWQRVHEGQPVPEKYRVMAFPAPEILRDEAPARTVQPEVAPTTEAAAPPPVVPIILNSQNSADRMKEITDRLETGIQELFESERYTAYLTSMAKFHSYSFNNTLLIAMQKPDASLVAGFGKWRADFEQRQQGSGGPAGPEGENCAIAQNISGCRKLLSPSRCGGSPLAEGAKRGIPRTIARNRRITFMDKRNRTALAYLLVGVAAAGRALLAVPENAAIQEVSLTVLALVGYLLLASKTRLPTVFGAAGVVLELILCGSQTGGAWARLAPALRAADLWLFWGAALVLVRLAGRQQSKMPYIAAVPLAVYTVTHFIPSLTSVAAVSFVVFSVVMLWFAAIMIRAYNDARIKK